MTFNTATANSLAKGKQLQAGQTVRTNSKPLNTVTIFINFTPHRIPLKEIRFFLIPGRTLPGHACNTRMNLKGKFHFFVVIVDNVQRL